MKAKCPNCEAVYQIDDSKIPIHGARVKCPKCQSRFLLSTKPSPKGTPAREDKIICPKCGHEQSKEKKGQCETCGVIFKKFKDEKPRLVDCKACGKKISINASTCPKCGEPNITKDRAKDGLPPIPADSMLCNNCGYVGKATTRTRGSFGMEILLWIFFLVPGLIYSIWRLMGGKNKVCPKCDQQTMIPIDSPVAQSVLEQKSEYAFQPSNKEAKITDDKKIKKHVGWILGWIFGCLLAMMGLGSISTNNYFSGLLYLLMAGLLVPPIVTRLESKLNIKLSGKVKAVILLICLFGAGIIGRTPPKTEQQKTIQRKEPLEKVDPEIKALVGTKYIYPESLDIIEKYGNPETLPGTNNNRWVAYFPKGNFTIISDKKTSIIKRVITGKRRR